MGSGDTAAAGQFRRHTRSYSELTLPAGTVAVTVELKDAQRLGTFLVAGSKIALLDNFTAAKGLTQTRVLVSSVLVLAVGGTTN